METNGKYSDVFECDLDGTAPLVDSTKLKVTYLNQSKVLDEQGAYPFYMLYRQSSFASDLIIDSTNVFSDSESGVKSPSGILLQENNGSGWRDVYSPGTYPLKKSAAYRYALSASDNVGNSTLSAGGPGYIYSKSFVLDGTPPEAVSELTTIWHSPKANQRINTISLHWTSAPDSDTESGLAGYQVYRRIQEDGAKWIIANSQTVNLITSTYADVELPPDVSTTFEFVVIPVDNVGNAIDPNVYDFSTNPFKIKVLSVYYAPLIGITESKSEFEDISHPNISPIIINSTLNIRKKDLVNGYKKITLKKVMAGFPIMDPGTSFTRDDILASIESHQGYSAWWGYDSDEIDNPHVIYHEQISAQYGQRNIRYEIIQSPQEAMVNGHLLAVDSGVNDSAGMSPVNACLLPNHPGALGSMFLRDADGNTLTAGDSTNSSGNAFKIGESLKTTLAFTASDIDEGTKWRYSIFHATPIEKSYDLYAESSLNEDPTKDFTSTISSAEFDVPIILHYGVNNIVVSWQEISPESGVAAAAGRPYEKVLSVDVEFKAGRYVLDVSGDWATHRTDGIYCRPGEPVRFTITGDGNGAADVACDWDWDGDGVVDKKGSDVTYAYDQRTDRSGDTSTYTLGLTITKTATAPTSVTLPVFVVDTRQGTLYKSETWIGEHLILGVVKVPAKMTLGIEPGTGSTETVTFTQDSVSAPRLGIEVEPDGKLNICVVGGSAILKKVDGQVANWDAIRVKGQAEIKNADLSGADRAVAVGGTGTATITGSTIHANKIGLHVVGGGTTVRVRATTIQGNAEYGVKEDSGGKPALGGNESGGSERNVTITGNSGGRNYYDWARGLLSPAELKAIAGVVQE